MGKDGSAAFGTLSTTIKPDKPDASSAKMKILYIFPHPRLHAGRDKILKEYSKGSFPDTLLMGLAHLENYNIEYDLLDLYALSHQAKILPIVKNYDVIVCKDATSGLLVGLLKKWKMVNKPLVFLDVVVHKNISGIKLKFLRYIFSGADRIIYCTSSLRKILTAHFGITGDVLTYIPWAIDDIFFRPANLQPQSFIFSTGDNDRDYATLIEAVQNTGLELKIATNLIVKKASGGIRITPNLCPVSLREEYARAKFVVVPLFDVPSASGATALLESMAMAKATIVSDSSGIRDFVKDGYDAVVVKAQDVSALRRAMVYLSENHQERERIGLNARRTVEKYFSTAKQAQALVSVYREVAKE